MKTRAVRLYGKNDLRLEEFDLPPIQPDEILAEIVTDSLCMSTLKAVFNGAEHRKVPSDIAEHPIIVGHEFCGSGRDSTMLVINSSSSRISAMCAPMLPAIPSPISAATRRSGSFIGR